jgi:hypothetical protein
MTQRSLHAVTKVHYRVRHALLLIPKQRAPLAVLRIPQQRAPLAPCGSSRSQSMSQSLTKNYVYPHSTEQDTQPIAFLISKQVIPYQTCGGTCCPWWSTPNIWSLADSSTTCHDGINHLHHSNRCSNHSIHPHTVTSHLDRWKTTSLSQRHEPTQHHKGWKDLYDS